MRLFVAVDLATRVRHAVGGFAADLASRLVSDRLVQRGGASWVAQENLHLTLRFIGEVDADAGTRLTEALAQPFALGAFELSLERLGVFPPTGPPRVLWIGVEAGEADLTTLAREVEGRLVAVDIPAEPRPFSGHLTLARFKRPPDRGLRDALGRLTPQRPFGPSPVDHVTLYESHLSPSGPTYRVLARAPLGNADPAASRRRP